MVGDFFEGRARRLELQAWVAAWEDEKPSRFFLQSERARQAKTFLMSLQCKGGVVTFAEGTTEVAAKFYEALFAEQPVDDPLAEPFLASLEGQLSWAQQEALEAPLSLWELQGVLKSMGRNKFPGADGLTVEFYLAFWEVLGEGLLEVLREGFAMGQLPLSMLSGLVTLLYKKGDASSLPNWRPITLLPVDYKVMAKVLVRRLREVMGAVVGNDQTCRVVGRACGLSLSLIWDTIVWAEQRGCPWLY